MAFTVITNHGRFVRCWGNFCYYKLGLWLLKIWAALTTKNRGRYYKKVQIYYKSVQLLQIEATITNQCKANGDAKNLCSLY